MNTPKKNQEDLAELNRLVTLLNKEKEALINNEASKMEAIVKEKEVFLLELTNADFSNVDASELKKVMKKIRELQETNLMLTKQTLAFQETLMSAISKGIKQSGNTYSNKGQHSSTSQASLLNQSL